MFYTGTYVIANIMIGESVASGISGVVGKGAGAVDDIRNFASKADDVADVAETAGKIDDIAEIAETAGKADDVVKIADDIEDFYDDIYRGCYDEPFNPIEEGAILDPDEVVEIAAEVPQGGIKDWKEINNLLKKAGLDENKVNEILATAKGSRPDPLTYLDKDYIEKHLSNFQDGVTKIKSKAPIDTEGVGLGTFVMPRAVADNVIAEAGGDVSKLEKLLGLNPGDLGSNPVRVDIPNLQNIRIPSGNEAGAWPGYWTPGGYTKPGGVMEAVIDPVPKTDYIVIENILEKR